MEPLSDQITKAEEELLSSLPTLDDLGPNITRKENEIVGMFNDQMGQYSDMDAYKLQLEILQHNLNQMAIYIRSENVRILIQLVREPLDKAREEIAPLVNQYYWDVSFKSHFRNLARAELSKVDVHLNDRMREEVIEQYMSDRLGNLVNDVAFKTHSIYAFLIFCIIVAGYAYHYHLFNVK